MAPKFNAVFALDPSATMIEQAEKLTDEESAINNIVFVESSAEELSAIEESSVDVVVSGQAAHWFDMSRVWLELHRVLRKGGTVAFWGYKDNVIIGHPKATEVLGRYCYENDESLMGPYWEQPGRSILIDLYRSIEPPEEWFDGFERREYEPIAAAKGKGADEVMIEKEVTLAELGNYVRTFSAYHNWAEKHPDRKAKQDDGEGDVVDDMFEEMLEAEPEWKVKGHQWAEINVKIEWGSVILMARKK